MTEVIANTIQFLSGGRDGAGVGSGEGEYGSMAVGQGSDFGSFGGGSGSFGGGSASSSGGGAEVTFDDDDIPF